VSRLSNISFSLFHFCTYNNKRRFKLLPLKNKKNGIFGKCANIQISFKVEWPKKRVSKWRIVKMHYRIVDWNANLLFFSEKKVEKKQKSNESLRGRMQGMTTWSFSTVTKIAFNTFFSKRFNWIVKIPKNGTQIHTNWTKNFSLNEIVIKPNIPFYQLFNKVI